MSDNKKKKVGRPPCIRLDSARLRKAIEEKKNKDNTFRQFRLGQLVLNNDKEKDAAGQWVSKLLRGEVGVDRDQLEVISALLGVNKDWLLGAPVFMNDAEKQAFKKEREKLINQNLRDQFQDFRKSPVYTLVQDYLHSVIFFSNDENGTTIEVSLKDDPRTIYTLTPDTYKMIEQACLDLCCSLIKHGAARDRIETTLEE